MADFTLTVKTDSSAELLDIVSKIAGSGAATERRMPTLEDFKQAERVVAGIESEMKAAVKEIGAPVPTEVLEKAHGAGQALIDEIAPERDAHGIKRDLRIHADAKEPLRASDNLWKRRKNVPDELYEEIHLELVREAKAAGLYTGPAIPELELEDRVEDTEQQTLPPVSVTVENHTDAELVVTQQPETVTVTAVAPPTPAPAPIAPPAPAQNLPADIVEEAAAAVVAQQITGMSAEATPTYQQAVVALFNAGGPTAPQVALQAMGLTIATQATPQQLRDMVTAAEMVTALGIAPADKPAKGPEHTREALAALGYVAS